MGNCQTSEAAMIMIERPDNRIERLYFSVTAQEVMSRNPGHYLALVVTKTTDHKDGEVKKHLKLLRPSDSLHIGDIYRLISFEDVLEKFNGRKCAKIILKKERGGCDHGRDKHESGEDHIPLEEEDMDAETSSASISGSYMMNMRMNRQQWRPALQSIPEVGS